MKLKEIERIANVAWSPREQYPVYLACGTAAQQLDATFSTKSSLEIFRFNPEDPGLECELVAAAETESRFNKIIWGNLGMASEKHASGVIVGAAENGTVQVWDAAKVIMEESDSLILNLQKHVGSVNALDFNNYQENLLASGGSDSEILLWDLNNPTTPMTPGAKSQPADDVTCLSWNCQVQHILASALNTRCVVWDLRKSEPIIKISDSMSRIRSKLVTWHPEIATQLIIASEDDHTPVVQLWDLRFAASPIKVLERHERGILSMAWSRRDPELLITCGKDNRLLCWNANADVVGGEVTYELPIGNQWCFDVQWCPRNPQCVSSCSFDGHVTVYTIMGGKMTTQPLASTSKIADSFGGFDNMSSPTSLPKSETKVIPQIAKAPKWLRKPAGVSFGFGGKLVTFSSVKSKDPSQPMQNKVTIHQVVSEKDIVTQSHQLEHALHNRQYHEYCSLKIANSNKTQEQVIWQFLQTNFESDARKKYLNTLGFDSEEVAQMVNSLVPSSTDLATESCDTQLPSQSTGNQSAADAFDQLSIREQQKEVELISFNSAEGTEGLLTKVLLTGKFDEAVQLCLHEGRMADAIILANAAGPELLKKTMKKYFSNCKSSTSKLISAIVQSDYSSLIDNTNLKNWKEALAVILTYAKRDEFSQLCDKLGGRLESCPDTDLSSNAILCYVCSGNIDKFVECWLKQTSDSSSSAALQELIEKVMMLRKSYEQLHGQEYVVQARSSLASKLGQYAEILAAEGSLKTALTYLSGAAQSQKLSVLKYRLATALGQHAGDCPWPKPTVVSGQPSRQNQRTTATNSRYAQQTQQQRQQYAGNQQWNAAAGSTQQPAGQPYGVSQHTQLTSQQPYYNPQMSSTPYSAYNGSAQTSVTSSYGYPGASQTQSTGFQQQPQYSATSSPYSQPVPSPYSQPVPSPYGQSASTPNSYQQPNYSNQPYSGYSAYGQQPAGHIAARGLLSKKYSAASESSQQPAVSSTQPAMSFYNPAAASNNTVVTPSVPLEQGTSSSTAVNSFNPTPVQNQMLGPASLVPSVDDVRKAPSGWNDPPAVHSKKEPEVPKSTVNTAPITQPVYNPNAAMQPMMGGDLYNQQYGNSMMQQQHYQPQGYSAQISPVQQQQYSAPTSPKAAPPPPIEKAPLPDQHKVIKEVLDLLADKCLKTTTNPQQKRKLEDVLKKLEFLYDRLRGNSLNDSILTGLHQIISAIKQYDYQTGLAVHTNLVMQGNFSEISAFMPGIKMLMQTAHQLQVFV